MPFPEILREARERRGYTQQQVADRMGITKSTYCGYETGKRNPDVQKIKQLSDVLGTSADRLLETDYYKSGASERNDETSEVLKMIQDDLRGIDPETINDIYEVIKAAKKLKGL